MRKAAAAAAVLVLLATATVSRSADPIDYAALAMRIVSQLALEPGERVLLLGGAAEAPALVEGLRAGVARARGTIVVRHVGAEGAPPLPEFDAVVVLPGASFSTAEYRDAHAALSARRRAVHFHWRGTEPALSASPVPGSRLPADHVIDETYERAVLGTDCGALGKTMQQFAFALRRDAARVTTPVGTDVRFEVRDRPVNVQDGDASAVRAARARVRVDRDVELPCGVVRVAPVEETVNGIIAFPPGRWGGRELETVRMRFEKGRVAEIWVPSGGREAVEAELERGGLAARSFREFALGFNPILAVPAKVPWIPYYGYGAGIVRLSLGDNTELGGSVSGGYVRWNFFTDATVRVGDEVWVNGESSRRVDGALTPWDLPRRWRSVRPS